MTDYREELDALKVPAEPDWSPPKDGPPVWHQLAEWHAQHAGNLQGKIAALTDLCSRVVAENAELKLLTMESDDPLLAIKYERVVAENELAQGDIRFATSEARRFATERDGLKSENTRLGALLDEAVACVDRFKTDPHDVARTCGWDRPQTRPCPTCDPLRDLVRRIKAEREHTEPGATNA